MNEYNAKRRARQTWRGGSWPAMTLVVDGREVLSFSYAHHLDLRSEAVRAGIQRFSERLSRISFAARQVRVVQRLALRILMQRRDETSFRLDLL